MKTLEERLRESDVQLSALRQKIDALANDPVYAGRPELWEADRNEFYDLMEELDFLCTQKERLLKEWAGTLAYDGFSPSLTKEEELAFFRSHAIRNREDILASASKIRENYRAGIWQNDLPLETLLTMLDRFYEDVSALELPDLTQDWWQYEITVRETDITLLMAKTGVVYDRGRVWTEKNRPSLLPEREFPLFMERARLLSPEEFGALHGVTGSTVRQWIRRGKLRSASKFGKEWRIPELSVVRSGKHYSSGSYSWSADLPDVPEEFALLNHYRSASISSIRGLRDCWNVILSREDTGKEEMLKLDGKAKERLELYLIGEPLVVCDNNCLGDYLEKPAQEAPEEPEAD